MKLLVKEWDKQIQTFGCTSSFLPSGGRNALSGGTDPPTPKGGWWPMTEAEAFPEKNGGKQRAERVFGLFLGELKGRWEHLRNLEIFWAFSMIIYWSIGVGFCKFTCMKSTGRDNDFWICVSIKDRADRSNQTSWWCGFERIQIWRHKQCVPSKQPLVAFNLDLEERNHCFIVNSL